MKAALFYDTETTGLPLFHEPSEDPRQPHIVQLGAALVDLDTYAEIASLDLIVRPDGWKIPDDVAAIHGITTERAMDVGVPARVVFDLLLELWSLSQARIGHNEQFDARMVRIALLRHRDSDPDAEINAKWKAGYAQCTQVLSTPILKLPPTPKMKAAGRFHHKSANLGEAYRFFTGKPLEGAHSAMVDVRACIEVYRAIQAGQRVAAEA
jgi:DNA polymerase-3 subunit epsilon